MIQKKLTINSANIPNLMAKFEQKVIQEEIIEPEKLNIQENEREGQIIKIDKPLFKKTLSRLVAMQVIYLIFEDKNYKEKLGTENLPSYFDEMMEIVTQNNHDEWGYFRGKQLAKTFIKQLVFFINENIKIIGKILKEYYPAFKYETVIKALIYTALGEYLMYTTSVDAESDTKKFTDYHSIIINEYVSVSQYFLHSNQIEFFNGILDNILDKINKRPSQIDEN